MKQKTIWIRFFLIGISLAFATLSSCRKVDYNIKADFIYINETNHLIEYNGESKIFNVNAEDTTIYVFESEGPKEVTIESYVAPLHSYSYPCIIKFDNIKCDTIENSGPADIKNYESRKISERYYEFTYRYTVLDFQNADSIK